MERLKAKFIVDVQGIRTVVTKMKSTVNPEIKYFCLKNGVINDTITGKVNIEGGHNITGYIIVDIPVFVNIRLLHQG